MAFASRKTKGRPRPVMNVTPLVDVVLVLLIIFMVVLPAMDEQIELELPSLVQADEAADEEPNAFTLAIDADGALYLDQVPVPANALEGTLRAAHRSNLAKKLILRGDRSLSYLAVRSIFKAAQQIGFPGVLLRVNERQGASSSEGG